MIKTVPLQMLEKITLVIAHAPLDKVSGIVQIELVLNDKAAAVGRRGSLDSSAQ